MGGNRSKTAPGWQLFCLGGLLGIAAFLLILGPSPLNVTCDSFCRGGYIEKDIQQHYAGWLFYRQSPLRFPLCIAQGINAPHGLSIAYTDSIPLFAAFFRLLEPLLPQTFQYFGWFSLLCCFLQGGFGALLLSLWIPGRIKPLVADLLFVCSPVLWERILRHTSLGAQFLVLAALYYYFKSIREDRIFYPGLFILNILAITIHPYFLPMTYALTFAMLLRYMFLHRQVLKPLLYLGSDLLLTLAVGWCFGLFYGTASGGSDALYGYFGMNLNALWNPVGVGGVVWSRFLPAQNQVGGNYDAFAYLGLGVLLGLILGVVWLIIRRRLSPLSLLRRHWTLALVSLLLTVFAISNVVTANGATLTVIPLPGVLVQLCSVFRSGGRMFWPVYYLLMLAACILVCRLFRKESLSIAAVSCLAVVQLWDLSPGLAQRSQALRAAQQSEAFPSQMTSTFWALAKDRYTNIASMDGIQNDALHLALYAADLGWTTNDPFAARYDAVSLEEERSVLLEELSQGTLRQDTLYLFSEEGAFLQTVDAVTGTDAWCGRVDGDAGSWYVIAPGMKEATLDERCITYGKDYPLRLADYTDGLWNRGVLDRDRQVVCFADSPFTRSKLEGASLLCAGQAEYPILKVDDSDPGWLMVTLEIEDATVLWDQELETK